MQSAKEENGSFQRTKNEALLTAGMGYGRRKALLMETFWSIVLPGLLNIGWEAVSAISRWMMENSFSIVVYLLKLYIF